MKVREDFSTIILAAGKGTRMKSPLPKVLHPVVGTPMITRTINVLNDLGSNLIRVVVGHGENLVRQVIEPLGATAYKQEEQLGTGHAVRCADPQSLSGLVLIMNGDHPLIQKEDLSLIIKEFVHSKSKLAVVTAKVKKPGQFGRIVRSYGELKAIVEAKDASHETLKINEINTGIYLADAEILNELLPKISNNNKQKEFYLTDIISLAIEEGHKVIGIVSSNRVAFGVNTQSELARANKYLFNLKNKKLLEEGVIIIDPSQTYIEEDVQIGSGTVIYPGCYLRSGTQIGEMSVVEPHCYIYKSKIESSVHIKSHCYFEEVKVSTKAEVGPFARLRPGTQIGKHAKVGNFVEMKKVDFKDGAKASHLTYLGDAIVGEDTNIGCGTITCNYAVDKKKYVTKIGKGVFVGSDTQFVAPIEIGDGAVIASGSTITKNVPANALAVARGKQFIKENYTVKLSKVDKEEKNIETSDSPNEEVKG